MRRYAFALILALLCSATARADTATAVVRGTAFACGTGAPLAGAAVAIAGSNGTRTVQTDARGRYVVVGVDPGTYRVDLNGDRAAVAAVRVGLNAGDVVVADIGFDTAHVPAPRVAATGCSPRPFFEPQTVNRTTVH
ncbi:MAG: carboxypeptidase-like regulatory domain-containing protein [Candidatus Velthaea sp.]